MQDWQEEILEREGFNKIETDDNKRQRDAVAAKMYVDWIERKENPFGDHFDINRNSAKEKTEQ